MFGTAGLPHILMRFFTVSDAKEAACGCAGCYTAYAAIEMYAEAFEQRNALDKLEAFASLNGPRFYGLPVSTITSRVLTPITSRMRQPSSRTSTP